MPLTHPESEGSVLFSNRMGTLAIGGNRMGSPCERDLNGKKIGIKMILE